MKFLMLLSFLAMTTGVFAASPCKNLNGCINYVSQLTGDSYFYSKELKGDVLVTSKFKIDKGNADYFLSMVLNENGYTRIPLENGKGYWVVSTRDIRYMPTKLYYANKDKLPETFDYIMMVVPLQYINAQELTRSFRPFMSRYGRIIDMKKQNQIIIQDSAINASRLLNLVKSMDLPLTDQQKKEREEEKKFRKELQKLRAQNGTDIGEKIDRLSMEIQQLQNRPPLHGTMKMVRPQGKIKKN